MKPKILLLMALAALFLLPIPRPSLAAYKKSEVKYEMPDVVLIDQDNNKVKLKDLVYGGKTILVDFIYATCTTICPVLSAGYVNLQKELGANSDSVVLISFSIDPEYDTPEIMTEYLSRYRAKAGWKFLTGSRKDINAVMNAFDAYIPNKMSHRPLTFMKKPGPGKAWLRMDGLMSTKDLLAEYRLMVPK